MGWKDADWAYTIDEFRNPVKAVLVAIAHRTDDKSHSTFVGHETIASMTGLSRSTVTRSVGVLHVAGILTVEHRNGAGGYRTSSVTTLDRTYVPVTYVGQTNVGDTNVGDSTDLSASHDAPKSVSATAEEITQLSHSVDHSEGPRKRGTRLPHTFEVTPGMVTWARERTPLVDGQRATEMFINHWAAATGRNATKLDWTAAWRNWLLKDQQTAERQPGRKQTPEERMRSTLALVPDLPMKEIS